MSQVAIYALVDPFDQDVFYVGKALNTQRRFDEHLRKAHTVDLQLRIRAIQEDGAQPLCWVLELADDKNWREVESKWIEFFRSRSKRLLNLPPGGFRGLYRGTNKHKKPATPPWEFNCELLKTLRMSACMDQGDLAHRLGVRSSSVSRWESGVFTPRVRVVTKIAKVFAKAPNEFMLKSQQTQRNAK